MCYIYLNLHLLKFSRTYLFKKKQIQNTDFFIVDFEKVFMDWELIWGSLFTTVKHLRSI